MKMIDRLLGFLRTLYFRRSVGGKVVATETVVSDGVGTVYQLTVKNTGKVSAKYKCILFVDGIDTTKQYTCTSGWSDFIRVGRYVDIYVRVSLPDTALPPNKEHASYVIFSILRAARL